jgi:hypothetical protein
MKRYFFILAFICAACNSWGQTEDQDAIREIKDFYVAYATNELSSPPNSLLSTRNSLREKYLTNSLIKKVHRMGTATETDAILRMNEVVEDMIKTLNIEHIDKNWYKVSYSWKLNDTISSYKDIPIRINKTEGRYRIDYITPIWNGSLYGDSLLFDNPVQQLIDDSSPMSFLKTFYAAYTMEYCSMSEDLTPRLVALREKYLTPDALAQFEEAEANADGREAYDLLINYFDFDRLWLPSMTYTQVDVETCEVCYTRENALCTITLKVTNQGEGYRIALIERKIKLHPWVL